jgi:hypothetical protein
MAANRAPGPRRRDAFSPPGVARKQTTSTFPVGFPRIDGPPTTIIRDGKADQIAFANE